MTLFLEEIVEVIARERLYSGFPFEVNSSETIAEVLQERGMELLD